MTRTLTLALVLAAISSAAAGQTSISATLMSDYRYRGVSLSQGQPAASVAINHDTASGLYVGAAVSKVRMRYTQVDAQAVAYAGFARRLGDDASWDVGVTETRYREGAKYNYREWYAGASRGRLNGRVSTSPHYFGVGTRSVYAELNGSYSVNDMFDMVWHVGSLRKPRTRTDLRIGMSAAFDAWNAQLAWVATRDGPPLYPALYNKAPRKLVLSLARTF